MVRYDFSLRGLFLNTLSVDAICQYTMPEEKEDYMLPIDPVLDPKLVPEAADQPLHPSSRSNLRLPPPPLFSRQGIPQNYKYV